MFLAERNIKLDIRLDIKFDIKLDIKFVLDRGVSGGLERVLPSASTAYILSWWLLGIEISEKKVQEFFLPQMADEHQMSNY